MTADKLGRSWQTPELAQKMTIAIGPVRIEDPVFLAPMSGVTDMPFRRLVKREGAGLVVSEMIASQAMIRESRQTLRMAQHTPEEFPMAVQLAGCEPEVMAEAAKLNEDRGAAIIDINFGCPVKKVLGRCRGGFHLSQPDVALEIVSRVREAVPAAVHRRIRERQRNRGRRTQESRPCGHRGPVDVR